MTKGGRIYVGLATAFSIIFAVLFFPIALAKSGPLPAAFLTALGFLLIWVFGYLRGTIFGLRRRTRVSPEPVFIKHGRRGIGHSLLSAPSRSAAAARSDSTDNRDC